MDKSSIAILSTTSLIPNLPEWQKVSRNAPTVFREFLDINSFDFSEFRSEIIFLVIFIDDLLPIDIEETASLIDTLEFSFSRIAEESKKRKLDIYVIFAERHCEDSFDSLKFVSPHKNICNYLRDELPKKYLDYSNLLFVDFNQIYRNLGLRELYDDRNYYLLGCHLSLNGLEKLVEFILRLIRSAVLRPIKVIAVDCDNTLWGGVIAEDSISGINLGGSSTGRAFIDFQRALLRQLHRGTLICLLSKNFEDDVWEVFDRHSEMVLSRHHITASAINWKSKSENLLYLARELDLSLESFVFWDDSNFERDQMRIQLPMVDTIEVPADVHSWPRYLNQYERLHKRFITEEDRQKTKKYQMKLSYNQDVKAAQNMDEFLKSIGLSCTFHQIDEINVARAEQLSIKTNQFNLRKREMSQQELKVLASMSNVKAFLVRVVDIYGDHGFVGLCIFSLENLAIEIETFLVSCRVLGRKVELHMMKHILDISELPDESTVSINFIANPRNSQCLTFLHSIGFESPQDSPISVEDYRALISGRRMEAEVGRLQQRLSDEFKN